MNETVTQNEKECKLNNRKLRQKPSGLVAGGERCTKRLGVSVWSKPEKKKIIISE